MSLKKQQIVWLVGAVILLGLAAGGWYWQRVQAQKSFLNDLTRLDRSYQQTLVFLKLERRTAAIKSFQQWVGQLGAFADKYAEQQPAPADRDQQFIPDLLAMGKVALATEEDLVAGDLSRAYQKMTSIQTTWHQLLKRNRLPARLS